MPDSTLSAVPLAYESIKRELHRRLASEWKHGTRLPPIKMLAQQMGVGQSSTHRAVKELVSEGFLMSRPGRGTFVRPGVSVGERADGAPTALADVSGERSLLGMNVAIFRSSAEGLLDPVVRALESELTAMGASVACETGVNSEDKFVPGRFAHAHALVLVNPTADTPVAAAPNQVLTLIDTSQSNTVAMGSGYDVVSVDSEQGGFLAGAHFRSLGVDRVCFLGAGADGYDQTSTLRLRGFLAGWGRPIAPEHRLRCRYYSTVHGARMVQEYLALRDRPGALFAASDDLAIGFVHGAHSHGLEPGRHYQIIGFDGQQRGRELLGGPLTTIDAPMRSMGQTAVRLIADRLTRRNLPVRRVLLGCTLFAGNTASAAGN